MKLLIFLSPKLTFILKSLSNSMHLTHNLACKTWPFFSVCLSDWHHHSHSCASMDLGFTFDLFPLPHHVLIYNSSTSPLNVTVYLFWIQLFLPSPQPPPCIKPSSFLTRIQQNLLTVFWSFWSPNLTQTVQWLLFALRMEQNPHNIYRALHSFFFGGKGVPLALLLPSSPPLIGFISSHGSLCLAEMNFFQNFLKFTMLSPSLSALCLFHFYLECSPMISLFLFNSPLYFRVQIEFSFLGEALLDP